MPHIHERAFKSFLKRQRLMIRKASNYYIERGAPVPGPTDWLYRMNKDVTEAIRHALTLTSPRPGDVDSLSSSNPSLAIVKKILGRFDMVARQLRTRRQQSGKPRPTLKIHDEYDVQDLLHALLKVEFDDVRREVEDAPSKFKIHVVYLPEEDFTDDLVVLKRSCTREVGP